MLDPIIFAPRLQVRVWGGDRLRRTYPSLVPAGEEPVGEAWLVSDLPGLETLVAHGPHQGLTPRALLDRLGSALGGALSRSWAAEGFPLLLKLIDAAQNLSVQVHPDDDAARSIEGQPRGKSEAWYVLNAEPDAALFLGTTTAMTADEAVDRLSADPASAKAMLHREPAVPGRVYPVPAGTLHAIGAGVLLAELQQASDVTYRVSDWGRVGLDGRPRKLHLDQARQCARPLPWHCPPDALPGWSDDGGSVHLLCRFPSFVFERVTLTGRLALPLPEDAPSLVLSVAGTAAALGDRGLVSLPPFHAALVPAAVSELTLVPTGGGPATLLRGVPVLAPGGPWRDHATEDLTPVTYADAPGA